MLEEQLLIVISLVFGVVLLASLSNKLKISYPILLVIGGLCISLIPGIPHIALKPDLIFLIFLPPLLFSAVWNLSWNEFWKFKRDIFSLAFGLVFFTSIAIAWVSHAIIPGFTLASGFLLGSVISPTDAATANSVLNGLHVPKRVIITLEGESLINDASGLIIFRFALASILTSQFHFWDAAGSFVVVTTMGILTGLIIAIIVYAVNRIISPVVNVESAITLIIPYIMYITAEYFQFSGVLAVVSGGLFLSYRSHRIFSGESRLRIVGLWQTLIFLVNGVVFILIGLQLPLIVEGLEGNSVAEAIVYAIVISLVTIFVRIIWVFPGAYLPGLFFKSIRKKGYYPGWRAVLLVGWTGMRGVVSLASALAIPMLLRNGEKFQYRNLTLFITFVVILFTVVLQGLSLKPVIRLLKIHTDEKELEKSQAIALRIRLAKAALDYLDINYSEETHVNEAYKRIRDYYERVITIAKRKLENDSEEETVSFLPQFRQTLIELIHIRRRELNSLRHKGEFSFELIRERERELDIEEARLRE